MKQKFKYIWMVILLIFIMAPADAAFRLYGNITRADGSTIVSGGLVEIIRVTGNPIGTSGTSPYIVNGSNSLSDGSVNTRLTETTGAIKSDGWLIGSTGAENVIVRAWYNRNSVTQTPDSSMYYAYSSQFPLGDPMAGVRPLTTNISAIYRASAPDTPLAPTVRVWYDVDFNPRVDVTSTHNSSSYNTEVVRTIAGDSGAPYVFTVAGAASRAYYSDSPTITISDLPVGSYTVSAQERNWFGLSLASPTTPISLRAGTGATGGGVYNLTIKLQGNPTDSYSVPIELSWASTPGITAFKIWASTTGIPGSFSELAGGPYTSPAVLTTIADQAQVYFTVTPDTVTTLNDQPRQIVGKYTYKLLKPSGLTGINSIALPFTRNWSQPAGADVADTELTNAPALRATMANFEFAGMWDAEAQTDIGYLSTGGGRSFGLLSGVGYQVSVSANNTFYTVVGIK